MSVLKVLGYLGLFFTAQVFATPLSIADFFQNKNGCFLLYDLTQKKWLEQYNPPRCAERIPPDSTFKVPLSLMAFDQKLITQNTVFKWDGQDKGLTVWNQNQTPQSWLENSAVWVSQSLTPQLGLNKIQSYLKLFNYGNQDFSGNPGKNDGLTQAWLNSSLKISANEQKIFLEKLIQHQWPISDDAMTNTLSNMYLETLPNGWKLYGKSGSAMANTSQSLWDGWFIGFVTRDNHTLLFVTNLTDINKPVSEPGGTRAREITKQLLRPFLSQ